MAFQFKPRLPLAEPHGERLMAMAFEPALQSRVWQSPKGIATAVLLLHGQAVLHLPGSNDTTASQGLIWVPRRSPAHLTVSAGSKGFVLHVGIDALGRALAFGPIASQVPEATLQVQVHAGLDDDTLLTLSAGFRALVAETYALRPGAAEAIEAHLRILMIALWRLMRRDESQLPQHDKTSLVQRFLMEVDLRLRDQPTTTALADHLGVTPDRLNRAVRRQLSKSPKQVMHAKLMLEAQSLLTKSPLQIDQISAVLGFSDPGYFSRFFTRRAGMPPGQFRKTQKTEPQTVPDPNFASWP